VDLIYDYCRRGKRLKKESDRNIVRKGGNGKEVKCLLMCFFEKVDYDRAAGGREARHISGLFK